MRIKAVETLLKSWEFRLENFHSCLNMCADINYKLLLYLQTDGNRIYKDLRNYVNAVRGKKKNSFQML